MNTIDDIKQELERRIDCYKSRTQEDNIMSRNCVILFKEANQSDRALLTAISSLERIEKQASKFEQSAAARGAYDALQTIATNWK